jgi:hypothetical protein
MWTCDLCGKQTDNNMDFLVVGGGWVGKSNSEDGIVCRGCEMNFHISTPTDDDLNKLWERTVNV